jgi:RES domain-containing protein
MVLTHQPAPVVVPVAAGSARPAARSYDVAVAELQQVLAQNRGRLDTTTVRVIEQNLATIDRAIAQAQRALAVDSANIYLNSHLAETMRRKLELLRQAAALVSAVS